MCGELCKSRCFKCDAFSKISGRLFTLTWPLKKTSLVWKVCYLFLKWWKSQGGWQQLNFNVAWSFESHKGEQRRGTRTTTIRVHSDAKWYFSVQKITLGQKSSIYAKIHIFKVSFLTKFTFSKSQISFFTKFTFSNSHFS